MDESSWFNSLLSVADVAEVLITGSSPHHEVNHTEKRKTVNPVNHVFRPRGAALSTGPRQRTSHGSETLTCLKSTPFHDRPRICNASPREKPETPDVRAEQR